MGRFFYSDPLQVASQIIVGNTLESGKFGQGTMFFQNIVTGYSGVIVNWDRETTGSDAGSNIVKVGQKLYGTMAFGGNTDRGTLYEVEPISGDVNVLHHFDHQGYWVHSHIRLLDSTFYGVMRSYSTEKALLFKYDLAGTGYELLDTIPLEFSKSLDHIYLGADDDLYFTNISNGANNKGCISKYNIALDNFEKVLDLGDTLFNIETYFDPRNR